MNIQLIRWPLLPPVIASDESVSVQCSSRDCERLSSLDNVAVFISVIFLHSAWNYPR